MAKKYYAVRVGKTPGIYETWDLCKSMVDGFSGAQYKSFTDRRDAEAYMGTNAAANVLSGECSHLEKEKSNAFAFVDGSYNSVTKTYGYGGFVVAEGEKHVIQGSGNDAEMASMHNVAGEILGSMAAINKAIELGISHLDIYYDYQGIEMWATGGWKRNKSGTIAYYDFIQSVRGRIDLSFVKVKGHSGVEGNEEADRLAKEAAGIPI